MTVTASLQALLERSIDFAGLFPPASLDLDSAVNDHAKYLRSSERWMLSTFVLPVSKFGATQQFLGLFDKANPLLISALGAKTENAAAFLAALDDVASGVRGLSEQENSPAAVSQLEMFLPRGITLSQLNEAGFLLKDISVFWEAPSSDAERVISLLANYNASRGSRPIFGYKMRTGGVTADAFPASNEIARALVAAAAYRVPIKFTAGLHHPVRQYREEVQTKMHGFLNVLGAAVLAGQHSWSVDRTTELLEDEEAGSFRFTDHCFTWRDWQIDLQELKKRRALVTTFGSCSFDEPRDDLRALGLL